MFGKTLRDVLVDNGVDASGVKVVRGETTGVAVIQVAEGDNAITGAAGANARFAKPIDKATLLRAVEQLPLVVTVEEGTLVKLAQDYVCQSCGAASSKWQGKCPSCGAWNSLSQEGSARSAPGAVGLKAKRRAKAATIENLADAGRDVQRLASGIGELDRAVGDGFARGSAVLLSGEPGIGKSTLLLQAAAAIATQGHSALYFSGEEATDQIRLRASRLGLSKVPLGLVAETCVERILATAEQGPVPDFMVIDSIQTLWTESIESAPGTVSQVRASMQSLIALAKARGPVIVVVGHVTKDGQIAGPKVIEHMVDAVLTFDGDNAHNLRLLRATKNPWRVRMSC